MIVIIDNYDSFTYNLYQCMETLGFLCRVIRNDAITVKELRDLKPSHIVISPGPGTPNSAGISLELIDKLKGEIPILGVCLGHQAIGQAFGGKIIRAQVPKHGKVSPVFHKSQGLFEGLESPFMAARYHSLIIERETIPECLEVTAETEDKTIMAIRHRSLPLQGVQFHPESIATKSGPHILKKFVEEYL
jgi:para-aminobenzoate synthetase component 2